MSGRATRNRRRSAAPDEEELGKSGEPKAEQEEAEQLPSSRRKRRRSASQPEEAQNGRGGADEDAGGFAAAAAPMQRLPRIPINQQGIAKMEEEIGKYKEESQAAHEKAIDLGVAQTSVEHLVSKVVRLMLFKNYEKPGVPVKREELIKAIQKDQSGGRGAKQLPSLVLQMAAEKLAHVFGLDMLEMKRGAAPEAGTEAGEAAGSTGGTQTFVLRSLLPPNLVQRFVQDAADDPARGLMTVVAALLELAPGKKLDAEDLARHLTQLGVLNEPADHESFEQMNVFGKEKAAGVLAHMERARFIVKKHVTRQVAGGGTATVYELAEAAHETDFKAGIKALLDQWLGPVGGAAPAAAGDAEGTEAQ